MLRGRRADSAKSIGAWRSQRTAECPNDFGENRMRADSDSDRFETSRDNVGNDFRRGRTSVNGPGQNRSISFEITSQIPGSDLCDPFEPFAIRQMNDQRIEARSLLRLENLRHGIASRASAASP